MQDKLTQSEFESIVGFLKSLGLRVVEENGFYDFINYSSPDLQNLLCGISKTEGEFEVNTLFGGLLCKDLKEVFFILQQDWNKENWVHGEEDGEKYISLKEGLK